MFKRMAAFLLPLLLVSCSRAETEEMLHIYTGMDQAHAIKAVEQFEQDTGIHVSFTHLSNTEVLRRLESGEADADIWYGGPATFLNEAKQKGLLAPYESEGRDLIPAEYKDEEGYWTGIYLSVLVIVINQQWHLEQGVSSPRTWSDLQRVEYKSWLTMADPRTSGTGFLTLTLFNQLYGEARAISIMKNLHQNITEYTVAGDSPGRYVGSKQSAATIMFAHDAIRLQKEGFTDLQIIFPFESTTYEIGAIAMIEGTENQEAAKTFIDWALTKEAQEVGKRVGNYQYLTNEQALSPVQAVNPDNLLMMRPNNGLVYERSQEWINNFEEAIMFR